MNIKQWIINKLKEDFNLLEISEEIIKTIDIFVEHYLNNDIEDFSYRFRSWFEIIEKFNEIYPDISRKLLFQEKNIKEYIKLENESIKRNIKSITNWRILMTKENIKKLFNN